MSYLSHSLGGESYPTAEMQSVYPLSRLGLKVNVTVGLEFKFIYYNLAVSAEMQSVYSTAPAEWATEIPIFKKNREDGHLDFVQPAV